MVFEKILFNGLIYTLIGAGYLFVIMIIFNPRIWGYQDYPERIKVKIPPQTKRERGIAGIVSIPWFLFVLIYPVVSTNFLKVELEGMIPFEVAFFNIFFMILLFFLADLVVLDWLIISKITPGFVIIEGTTPEDYKNFSEHYKDHLIAAIPLFLLCIIFSVIIVFL